MDGKRGRASSSVIKSNIIKPYTGKIIPSPSREINNPPITAFVPTGSSGNSNPLHSNGKVIESVKQKTVLDSPSIPSYDPVPNKSVNNETFNGMKVGSNIPSSIPIAFMTNLSGLSQTTTASVLDFKWEGEYAGEITDYNIAGTFETDGDNYIKLRGYGEQMFLFIHITKPDVILCDQLKEMIGLPKLGTSFAKYLNKFYLIVRPHILAHNKQGIDAKLDTISQCKSNRFEFWMRLSWIFRVLMGFTSNHYNDIRVRLPVEQIETSEESFVPYRPFVAPSGIPYPVIFPTGTIGETMPVLSNKIRDKWFPGTSYYDTTKLLVGISDDVPYEEIEILLQQNLTRVVEQVSNNVRGHMFFDYSKFTSNFIQNLRSIIFSPTGMEYEANIIRSARVIQTPMSGKGEYRVFSTSLGRKDEHRVFSTSLSGKGESRSSVGSIQINRRPIKRMTKPVTLQSDGNRRTIPSNTTRIIASSSAQMSGPVDLPLPSDEERFEPNFDGIPEDQFGEYPFSQTLDLIPPHIANPGMYRGVKTPTSQMVNGVLTITLVNNNDDQTRFQSRRRRNCHTIKSSRF